MVIEGRTWLELLTPATCWELLAATGIGRVAVMAEGRPEIYPVNYVVDDESIVFRTDVGTKLAGLLEHPATSFEVDGVGREMWSGWSVLVKGRAVELHTGEELARAADLPLRHWAWGEKTHWIRIVPAEVTGRRIRRPAGQ